ncbi:dolichol-phosphate mannosyltransferase subunit 3-like [Tubulanus polymorphus]|uniref:dolichol-phosphate mannosyltransferase subunit 3-like n=1 Tax=Tubulanus polymorphus TaxID=672921 RepID=UPI003DA4A89F
MPTKLVQWIIVTTVFIGVWTLAVTTDLFSLTPRQSDIVIALPIYLLMTFACYSLAVVGYRVATFNDCPEAAEELRRQIAEAKTDLAKKGIKFT